MELKMTKPWGMPEVPLPFDDYPAYKLSIGIYIYIYIKLSSLGDGTILSRSGEIIQTISISPL
jgi:hypothetical protein